MIEKSMNPESDGGQACVNAKKHAYLIGLDIGTSALKGILMSDRGDAVHTAERTVHYCYPQPGRVEMDAEQHWREVTSVLQELAAASPGEVCAVAFSGASGNTMLAGEDGRPLTPIINWMDQRCAGDPPGPLKGLTPEDVRRVTGWPCLDSFPLAHLAWLRKHKPALLDRAAQVCMNTDWLLFRLTGSRLMDHSTATTFHLQDQAGRCWHGPYLKRLGIAEDSLSKLTCSGAPAGRLTREAAAASGLSTGTTAVTGCFDHPSAARAAGALQPGQLLLSCGTSWVGFMPHSDRDALLEAGLLCDPFLSESGGPWGGIFSIVRIGRNIDWYIDNIIAPGRGADRFRVFNESAAEAEPGAGGLTIDLREPPRKIDAGRRSVSRAVMEGAAALLAEKLSGLKERGYEFRRAVLAGGPGKSPVWPGIIAEATGLDLGVASVHSGARGAAILAGIGAGVYKDEKDALKRADKNPDMRTAVPAPVKGPGRSERDRRVYEKELSGFLPEKIFDVHVHLFEASCRRPGSRLPSKSCYRKFGGEFKLEQYLDWAAEWLPDQEIHLNSFGSPSMDTDRDRSASYTGKISDNSRYFGMILISPEDPLETVDRRLKTNRLTGFKPYLEFVGWKPPGEVTIEDMLTAEQLEYADELGLAVMLHIPRPERLADPLNQKQMPALCRRYPRVKFIFAHTGRAYYLENVLGGLDRIAECSNAFIDTAMVNHEGVLEHAFLRFPRDRILFGSDAPIAMLRGKSVEINNQYAYLMGEDCEVGTTIYDAEHAVEFTTFYYEQLRGLKLAAERAGLSERELEGIFFSNAEGVFRAAGKQPGQERGCPGS